MCSNSFSSSVTTLIFLSMFSSLVDLGSSRSTTTESGPCRKEAPVVCQKIGSPEDHMNALTKAFSGNQEIDLIFIICNTTECTKTYSAVITFIKSLVTLVTTKYDSYIDAYRLHISVIVYDNTSVRLTLNDTQTATPKVGNCEFDTFLGKRMASSEARGERDGMLKESLDEANKIFSKPARPNARKILWLFSECGYCEQSDKRQGVETAAGDIKRGYRDNVFIFTVGINQCPVGWFVTLAQEDTMKTIATTASGHYACIDKWIEFTKIENDPGNISQHWSEVGNDAAIGQNCGGCANSKSTYRCTCKVSSKQYECHVLPWPTSVSHIDPSTLAIALGAGIGGGLLVVIIIVVIIVVVVRRCKKPDRPPPRVPPPRTDRRPPASPPAPTEGHIYNNPDDEQIEYEVMETERDMDGWSAHLVQLKREHPVILHLGVYSVDKDYFAQTPGFTFTESQKMALDEAMTNGNSSGKPRKKSEVTVGGITYVIERKTREKLSAQTKDKKTRLGVVYRGGYLVVGVAEANGSDQCDKVIAEVLDAVNM